MLKDLFRSKPKYVTVKPRESAEKKRQLPDGLWTKCESCGNLLFSKELAKNLFVCEKCNYHFRIGAWERLAQLVDAQSFNELGGDLRTANPLGFPGYEEKLAKSRESTGLSEAAVVGRATMTGIPVAIGVIDFGFIGGTMGSVMGEKIALLFEHAIEEKLPVIIVSAGGGGARMHEGIISLMQMAKTSQAVERHNKSGLLYIAVLTDPTMGGIYASFASLADIILAEPGALIGFAGPRVVEETIRQSLPPGFQRAEFALKNGMVDMIVERKDLKRTIISLLGMHGYGGN